MAFIFRTDMKCALNNFFDNINFVRQVHHPKNWNSVMNIIYKCHFGFWRWNILMPYYLLSTVPEKVKWGWSGTQNILILYQPAWTSVSYSRILQLKRYICTTYQYLKIHHLSPAPPPPTTIFQYLWLYPDEFQVIWIKFYMASLCRSSMIHDLRGSNPF